MSKDCHTLYMLQLSCTSIYIYFYACCGADEIAILVLCCYGKSWFSVGSHVLWVLFHSKDLLPLITNWRVIEAIWANSSMIEIVTLCDPNPILSGTFTMNDRAGEFEPVWTKEEHKIKTTSLLDLWNTYLCSKKRRKDDTSVSRITKAFCPKYESVFTFVMWVG